MPWPGHESITQEPHRLEKVQPQPPRPPDKNTPSLLHQRLPGQTTKPPLAAALPDAALGIRKSEI